MNFRFFFLIIYHFFPVTFVLLFYILFSIPQIFIFIGYWEVLRICWEAMEENIDGAGDCTMPWTGKKISIFHFCWEEIVQPNVRQYIRKLSTSSYMGYMNPVFIFLEVKKLRFYHYLCSLEIYILISVSSVVLHFHFFGNWIYLGWDQFRSDFCLFTITNFHSERIFPLPRKEIRIYQKYSSVKYFVKSSNSGFFFSIYRK